MYELGKISVNNKGNEIRSQERRSQKLKMAGDEREENEAAECDNAHTSSSM